MTNALKISALALFASSVAMPALAANDYFSTTVTVEENAETIEFGDLNSPGDGQIVVYDYAGDTMGEMLGTQPVTAGANSSVMINLSRPATDDVLAVLINGGEVVAAQTLRSDQS